ncbi:MAG: adenylyl-sulfate kinase [Desulfovibrionaceae bacterium]|nr:adenylyl-sulfate kinase [Desulfovibrionaceae bacterium]
MAPVIWLLGMSGTGKTTLGSLLRLYLESQDLEVTFLDADRFRKQHGFSGFSREERLQSINALREEVLDLQAEGEICVVAAITPYKVMRDLNRETIPFYREVWVRCSLNTLFERETKGFYRKATCGQMDNLSGITSSFDEPQEADLILDTDRLDLADCYVKLRNLACRTLEDSQRLEQYLHHYEHSYANSAHFY